MIGGVIVLGLFLTALTAMVVLSQQIDTYQNVANRMSQKDTDRLSENLVATYPGLAGGFPASCGGTCTLNQYNMSLANAGGVAVQITQMYINSTQQSTGCTITNNNVKGPCLLSAQTTATPFSFNSKDSYINAGEINHIVRLWLPPAIALPNASLTPANSIWIVTTRGRVFSFEWPFPPVGQGQGGAGSPTNLESGSMSIAYNGTYNSNADTCHTDTPQPLPATVAGKNLYFLKPWITSTILGATSLSAPCTQCLYIAVRSSNTLTTPITFSWGQLVILTARADSNRKQYFIGGPYVGIVLKNGLTNSFYPYRTVPPPTVQPGTEFYLIFKITNMNVGSFSVPGESFTGTATINNGYSTQAQGATFRQFVIYLDGLYVRTNGGPGC